MVALTVHVLEGRDEDIAQTDNILMSKMFQEFEFAVCSFGENRCAEGLHDLLNRDGLASQLVFGGADEPESTHAHRLQIGVPACDLERRPKDLGSHEFGHLVNS